MRGGNPNPTQNNRGKQGRSIYTPAKRLLGPGTPSPGKELPAVASPSPLTGVAARPADASKYEEGTSVRSPILQYPQRSVATYGAIWQGSKSNLVGIGASTTSELLLLKITRLHSVPYTNKT